MLKLSKKAEYALMAVKYIACTTNGNFVTAKEISVSYDIPYELLAKVLQNLTKFDIVKSYQGVKGGYQLTKMPAQIPLLDVIKAVDGNYKITECMNNKKGKEPCSHLDCCVIKDPLIKLQLEIDNLFRKTTINNII